MIRTVIVGAAGRMGRRLVALTAEDAELKLTAAIEAAGNPLLGQDAGTLAGVRALGVPVTADLRQAAAAADVVIDFSSREVAVANAKTVLGAGGALVLGTTGLTEADKAAVFAAARGGRLIYAPNFSVGMNLMFAVAAQMAKVLGDDYDVEIVEIHHNQKVDAPSGSAVRLAEGIAAARGLDYARDTVHGRRGQVGKRRQAEIGMHAVRGGDVVGDHTVMFATGGERLELTHRASSRDTFAKGALRAAKFLAAAKPGTYEMRQVLGL